MEYTNLTDASAGYRAARERLRAAEIELVRHREEVARLRRDLPQGPVVEDYELAECPTPLDSDDGTVRPVRLSELFTGPDRPLIVYHLMFGKRQTSPCPMCTMWVDGFNGVARHVRQSADFAVVAAAGPGALREHGRRRGWDDLRLVSAGASSFAFDLGAEDAEGNQDSRVSVFTRDRTGAVRHFYTGSPHLGEEAMERGIDLLCPTWHLLDLTPAGRGDWYSALEYPDSRD